jgi:hypothetical protein
MVMDFLPELLWAIEIAGVVAIAATACVVLYGGGRRAGLGARRAAQIAGAAAVLLGGWFVASAVIASNGGYGTPLGPQVPWMPVAVVGSLVILLALSRVPVVAQALAAPDMVSRLMLPHAFRVAGIVFLIAMAMGRLPALFAVPAAVGDIATGIAAPLVARRLARGTGRRSALWFTAFGIMDLVVALTLGALIRYQLVAVTPSGHAITELPLVLIPTVAVPLMLTLHITSVVALTRSRRAVLPGAGPVGATR